MASDDTRLVAMDFDQADFASWVNRVSTAYLAAPPLGELRERIIESAYQSFGRDIAWHNFEPLADAVLRVILGESS